jgi:hypothetical protein
MCAPALPEVLTNKATSQDTQRKLPVSLDSDRNSDSSASYSSIGGESEIQRVEQQKEEEPSNWHHKRSLQSTKEQTVTRTKAAQTTRCPALPLSK